MKIIITPILIGLISFSYASQYDPKDKASFEQTHVCKSCNLVDISGFVRSSPLPDYTKSILTGSDLSYTKFGCNGAWNNSNFDNTLLIQSNFSDSQCGMVLDGSSFVNANLLEAKLTTLDINNVNFTGANLSNSTLNSSRFHYSDFTNAHLDGSDISYADFCHALISEEQIKSTKDYSCAIKPDCSGRYPYKDGSPC